MADSYKNNCSIKANDYTIIDNADYQPTNSILLVHQWIVLNRETCAYKCLDHVLCLTATFRISTGQCIFYFEQMIHSRVIPFSGGSVLSVNTNSDGKRIDCVKI